MDPWLTSCARVDVSFPEICITKFEDNFTPILTDKLPDSEKYLATLEEKLKQIKSDPDFLAQLAAKKEACMQQLLSGTVQVENTLNPEEPIASLQILRTIAPHKQALSQGEIVHLVKYDQLEHVSQVEDTNKDPGESFNL